MPLEWRHNESDSVSNHQPHYCLLTRLFRHRSKKTSKLCVTGFVRLIQRWPVNSPHKGPVTRMMFPFDDVIIIIISRIIQVTRFASNHHNVLTGGDMFYWIKASIHNKCLVSLDGTLQHRSDSWFTTLGQGFRQTGYALLRFVVCVFCCCLFVQIDPYSSRLLHCRLLHSVDIKVSK